MKLICNYIKICSHIYMQNYRIKKIPLDFKCIRYKNGDTI